ncbi:MAG: 30S ribosomal protein S21 [Dehalococcoidales bacterium]|nr:30S ribosomal protein S21 [Dehalococcoidales bacterium]
MANVVADERENFESLLRRFSRKVQQDGIIAEARRRGRFQKPITRRARKASARRRQAAKAAKPTR